MMIDSVTEVLVVGSGPVGLMLAVELSRRGVSTRIIDRAECRDPQSRALVIHARTLETLDLAGLADEFVKLGYPAPGLNIGLDATRQIAIDMRALPSRYPFMLILPQRETERLLATSAKSRGAETEWSTPLVAIEQTAAEVMATVETPSGSERIRAQYVVGCDGAHSTVRKLVGIPFDGTQHSELVFIGDVKMDASFPRSRLTNFTSPRGFVSILPFLGDYVRVFAVDFAQQDGRDEELRLEELQATMDAIAPFPVILREPRWLTRYIAPSRGVRTARVGRVFLAGDAAHAHAPAGGQGMNTGIQDAANLGWKLALALRGHAPSTLLDTYHRERHPVHEANRRQTDRMFRAFVVRNAILRVARRAIARLVIPRAPVQRRLAERLSGVGVSYAGDRSCTKGPVHKGDRVPDTNLWTAGRPLTRLYEILRRPGYTMIVYVTADRVGADLQALRRVMATTSDPEAVHSCVVTDEGVLDPNVFGGDVFVDITGNFANILSARHGDMFLIRPDGYLAARCRGFDPLSVSAAFADWLSPSVHPEYHREESSHGRQPSEQPTR